MNEKMMKRTYDMLVRLINTRILDAERITQEMADDLFLLIDEVYNA